MPTDLIMALAGFAFVMSITPGPNNVLLLSSGVNFGFRRTVPHMLGICFGCLVMFLAIGLGLGTAFAAYPAINQALRAASVVYMLWLAWKIASAAPADDAAASANARPMTFIEGALFQWVNPKAWAMALTSIAAYTVPANFFVSLGILLAVFSAVNIPSVAVWTMFGVGLRGVLQDPVRVRIFNVVMALLLVASIWPLIADLKPA